MKPGEILPLRVLYEGAPLTGLLLRRFRSGDADPTAEARTDAEGRVRFRIDRGGTWMIAGVHVREAPADVDADWESFWISLTFTMCSSLPTADAEPESPQCRTLRHPSPEHHVCLQETSSAL